MQKFIYRKCSITLRSLFAVCLFLTAASAAIAQVAISELDQNLWALETPFCKNELPDEGEPEYSLTCQNADKCFPSKVIRGSNTKCQDGDMTLFNGLLCRAGYVEGCMGVEGAQDDVTGRWFRSPRFNSFPELVRQNSFSPDQARGVILWLLSEKSASRIERFEWWIGWLGRNQRCLDTGCFERWPRVCPDDDIPGNPEAKLGCTMSPGNIALIGTAMEHVGLEARDPTLQKLFDRYTPQSVAYAVLSAQVNEAGYPQHLAALDLWILQQIFPDNQELVAAALLLRQAQPMNPFFAFVSGAPEEEVEEMTLALCPLDKASLPALTDRSDWAWQRKDAEAAWERAMIWECRFMAGLHRMMTGEEK